MFIVDFEKKNPLVFPLDQLPSSIRFDINGKNDGHYADTSVCEKEHYLDIIPFEKEQYKLSFEKVLDHINYGNSYLLNLTGKSEIKTDLNLTDIYRVSNAKYKILVDDQFVVFSPESFIKVKENKIYTYPMKGTISANIPDARQKILDNQKELAEHYTIVDLLRNDLSIVSKNVTVDRFRYVDTIHSPQGDLLQVSSQISGNIKQEYQENFGSLLDALLPAGSICGAPKKRTVEIIKEVEADGRGYYTGVFGVFDGESVDSGVMIRFIEKNDDILHYRSGGGLTFRSEIQAEYQELIDKIYVPTSRNHTNQKRQTQKASMA